MDGFGFPSELIVLADRDDSLIVGVEDVATMNVNNRGHVSSGGAIIARDLTASGSEAFVNGPNSYWETHGDMVVGGRAQGELTVANEGYAEIDGTLWIGGAPTEKPPEDGGPTTPSVVLITGDNSSGRGPRGHGRGFRSFRDALGRSTRPDDHRPIRLHCLQSFVRR